MDGLRAATAAGNIDERFVEVLRGLATVAARARAAPTGAPRWSAEDIDDLALETIGRVTPAKVVLAARFLAIDGMTASPPWLVARCTSRTSPYSDSQDCRWAGALPDGSGGRATEKATNKSKEEGPMVSKGNKPLVS